MRWLSDSHGNDRVSGLASPRRFRQYVHGMEGFDIAALG
jgi:hypothetical protein